MRCYPARLRSSHALIFRVASRVPVNLTFSRSFSNGVCPSQIAVMVPYEQAIALLDLSDTAATSEALELVEELGATPLIQVVRRPKAATELATPTPSSNGELTPRQQEILCS